MQAVVALSLTGTSAQSSAGPTIVSTTAMVASPIDSAPSAAAGASKSVSGPMVVNASPIDPLSSVRRVARVISTFLRQNEQARAAHGYLPATLSPAPCLPKVTPGREAK